MSDIWLVLALVGTFLTIVLIGVIVDMFVREKNRPMTLLQSQVGQVETVDLRQQQLEGSAVDRIVMPGVKRIGRGVVRLTPFDLNERIAEKLVLAGNPVGWDPERVVALKIIGAMVGGVGSLLLMSVLPLSGWLRILFVVIFALIGYTVPSTQVNAMAGKRQRMIQKQLPDVMDLLTISVEAGLGLDAAISQVVKNVPGPLAEEFSRLSQEIQIGVSRSDAFRHLSDRTTVPELRSFVVAMVQADLFGVSIANVLRAQSRELRQKRRQRAEEIAQKIPVKLLFPMIFMVLPALFIVILGPGAIKIYEEFFGK
ncbi:MAG TPA: type II secretion system F family protein [Actinomycetota bacterium]|jgi:tight adherence protein C